MKQITVMKLGLALAIACLGSPVRTCAAEKIESSQPAAGDRADALRERMKEVSKELGLTEQQKEKLKPILQAEMEKLKALRDDTSLSRRAKFKALRAIQSEYKPQVKAVLTPEQYKKWEKMRAERRAGRRGK
jgi:Spy/CpxP family protein refolding chaperone